MSVFSYDKGNRLIKATNWQGKTYAYTYDVNGNRTKTTVDGTTTQSLSFNANDQISSSGYAYDKAGRRTSDPKQGTTSWNTLGQAVKMTKGSVSGDLSYSGLGQDELIRQTAGSDVATYTYGRDSQAGIPTLEYATKTGDEATVVNNDAAGMPISMEQSSGMQFLMYDGFGQLFGTVDGAGTVTSKYVTDPYGHIEKINYGTSATSSPSARTATAGTSQTPWATFGVKGQVATGYWKRGARWNDTATATWTSVDPVIILNDPDRANPYNYVGSNPLNYFDPSGRSFDGEGASEFAGNLLACNAAGELGGTLGRYVGFIVGGPFGSVGGAALGYLTACAGGIVVSEYTGFSF